MDPNSNRLESERWLSLSTKLLATRDFLGSKTFAIRARESDPTNNLSDQILAVAETVLAGEKRVNPSQQPDWYSVLQLPRLVRDPDLIGNHYHRLVLLLNPDANRLPFADYALQLVMDSWSVLSDPNKKWLFDNELALHLQQQQPQPPYTAEASNSQVNTFQFFQPTAESSMWQQQQNQNQNQESQWQVGDTGPTVSTSVAPTQTIPRPIPARVIDGNVNIVGSSNVVVNDTTHVRYDGVVHDKNTDAHNNNNNNNVDNNQTVVEEEEEEEEDNNNNNNNDVESFWTSCPYCLYMYEYEKQYLACSLRCQNCRRGFHGAEIPNPPPIDVNGPDNKKSSSFCCWGFFPLGFSSATWKKNNNRTGKSNWVPFSPLGNRPAENQAGTSQWFSGHAGASEGPKETGKPPVSRSRVYMAAVYDDAFDSEPSDGDSSDQDWRRNPAYEKKRKMNTRQTVRPTGESRKANPQDVNVQNQANPNLGSRVGASVGERVVQDGSGTQNVVTSLPSGAKEDARRKVTPTLTKNQARKRVKNMGKLDLNVEFNNEGDEHAPTVSAVNGEEDAIENIGFFEGLDEFFSNLPILNVGEQEKAKRS